VRRLVLTTILLILLLATSVTRAHAFTNGQSASLVIGQMDFTSSSVGTSQTTLWSPLATAIDPSGNLWVGDAGNSRILEFKPPYATGMQASLVLGQPGFGTSTPVVSQQGLSFGDAAGGDTVYRAFGLCFDHSGNLWVVDGTAHRVLEFLPPFANGMPASLVIGQKDFATFLPGSSKNGFFRPSSLAFDHSGNLWVLDKGNNRVLEFVPPFNSGMNASLVLGQANFDTTAPSSGQSRLATSIPAAGGSDLAVDPFGYLWVSDAGNNRVLEFRPPFANGMDSSLVIGQKNFTTRGSSATRSELGNAGDFGLPLASDSAGNLWVGDSYNNRLLEFQPPFSNGMNASTVIGQEDFTASAGATTRDGLSGPGHPVFDSSGSLWVTDFYNNRLLEFTTTPVPEFPTASLAIIALVSLAIVGLVSRKFFVRLPAR
jgi:hypothetical protein